MTSETVTIACDESGAEGENIAAARDPVFVHASTNITTEEAEFLLAEFRAATRTQAPEIKSRTALSGANRSALLDMLHQIGDRGNIYLLEKQFYMSSKLVHTMIVEPAALLGLDMVTEGRGRMMASVLHELGPASIGSDRWAILLQSFNDLIRLYAREGTSPPDPERFQTALGVAREACTNEFVAELLEWMWDFRSHIANYGDTDSRSRFREFDPMYGTLASVAMTWTIRLGNVPLEFVMDRYGPLDQATIERITEAASDPLGLNPHPFPRGNLEGIRLVDSKSDFRVQIADILAGCGQAIAKLASIGILDDALQESTREMLDCNGMWADTSGLDKLWELETPRYVQRWLTDHSP